MPNRRQGGALEAGWLQTGTASVPGNLPGLTCRSHRSQEELRPSSKVPGAQSTHGAYSSEVLNVDPGGQGWRKRLGCGSTSAASEASLGSTRASARPCPMSLLANTGAPGSRSRIWVVPGSRPTLRWWLHRQAGGQAGGALSRGIWWESAAAGSPLPAMRSLGASPAAGRLAGWRRPRLSNASGPKKDGARSERSAVITRWYPLFCPSRQLITPTPYNSACASLAPAPKSQS
jgi:hypothetical protein